MVTDPIDNWDAAYTAGPKVRGGSRNGWFERKCRELLDVAPNHESLRFLSMQSATRERRESGSLFTWTVLNEQSLQSTLDQLETLLIFLGDNIEFLFEHLEFDRQGYALKEIRVALSNALESRDFPEKVTDGGEDDTPEFMFSWLVALRSFLSHAKDNDTNVLYVSWHQE